MSKILVSLVPATCLVVALLTNLGCATSFQGSAQFPGGPAGCRARCSSIGGTMQQFVFVGSYSTACVCGPRDDAPTHASSAGAAGATTAAAVAVMTQTRNAEEQQQRR